MTNHELLHALENLRVALAQVMNALIPDQPAPAEAAKPVAAPVIELEDLRAKLAELSRTGHTEQVRQLIQNVGADKLSEVDPARYGELLEAAKAVAA